MSFHCCNWKYSWVNPICFSWFHSSMALTLLNFKDQGGFNTLLIRFVEWGRSRHTLSIVGLYAYRCFVLSPNPTGVSHTDLLELLVWLQCIALRLLNSDSISWEEIGLLSYKRFCTTFAFHGTGGLPKIHDIYKGNWSCSLAGSHRLWDMVHLHSFSCRFSVLSFIHMLGALRTMLELT